MTETVAPRTGWASLKDLNRYQWFVFAVAAIAWMADCMDQQLFNQPLAVTCRSPIS